MIDVRVIQHMSEMTDDEWTTFHCKQSAMLAYRYARERLEVMPRIKKGTEQYEKMEEWLYNMKLNEFWDKLKLPMNRWPGNPTMIGDDFFDSQKRRSVTYELPESS